MRRIKSSTQVNRIPVVLFSSDRRADTVDLAYSLGANAFFSKPISLDQYISKIRILVEHWLDLAELPTPVSPRLQPGLRTQVYQEDELA